MNQLLDEQVRDFNALIVTKAASEELTRIATELRTRYSLFCTRHLGLCCVQCFPLSMI